MSASPISAFPAVERSPVDAESLSKFTTESEFTALGVDLLTEAASYVCIACCVLGDKPTWAKEQAVVGGNAVRLYKLYSLYLEQTCERKRELTDIIARLIFETAVSVRYMVAHFSTGLVDSYMRQSMRYEKKLFDLIESNIARREGVVLPIEDRMLKSLERASKAANIPLESINLKNKTAWGGKNLYEKTVSIGWEPAYLAVFSGMSHNVHGSWQDLLSHHLETHDDGRFSPELEWSTPRPQPLFALGLLALEVVMDVVGFLGGPAAAEQLEGSIADLEERILQVNAAHEKYLSGKLWPAI